MKPDALVGQLVDHGKSFVPSRGSSKAMGAVEQRVHESVRKSVQLRKTRRTNCVALRRHSTRYSAISAQAVERRSIAFDRAIAHATFATAITIVKSDSLRANLCG